MMTHSQNFISKLFLLCVAGGGTYIILSRSSDFISSLNFSLILVLCFGAIGAFFLSVRPVLLLWFATFFSLVVAGTVKYFIPPLGHIWWLAYGTALLMYFVAFVFFFRGASCQGKLSKFLKLSLAGLLFTSLMSSAFAASTPAQVAVATKSLFVFGGVWAFFRFYPVMPGTVYAWLKTVLYIGLLQWPIVFYQYFFVRSGRIGKGLGTIEASDSVVGTFGGSMESGGLTAVLAFFLIVCLIVMLAFYKEKLCSKKEIFTASFLLVIPLLLMEAKIIFFYIPIALFFLFRKDVARRPFAFLGWSIVLASFLGGVLLIYQLFHWSAAGTDLQESFTKAFTYSFQSKVGYQSSDTAVLTRRGVLDFWITRHGSENFIQTMIGHGIGASRTVGQVTGCEAVRYAPANIDRTGLALFLWDFGIIGVILILGVIVGAYRQLSKTIRTHQGPRWQLALAAGLQAVLPLLLMSMLYRNDIPYAAPMMFILMAILGLGDWLSKQRDDDKEAKSLKADLW